MERVGVFEKKRIAYDRIVVRYHADSYTN